MSIRELSLFLTLSFSLPVTPYIQIIFISIHEHLKTKLYNLIIIHLLNQIIHFIHIFIIILFCFIITIIFIKLVNIKNKISMKTYRPSSQSLYQTSELLNYRLFKSLQLSNNPIHLIIKIGNLRLKIHDFLLYICIKKIN